MSTYVAQEQGRSGTSGAGLIDSGWSTIDALCQGRWIDAALSGVSTVLDTAAAVSDPLGSLIAAGIGWVIDHLNPIKRWFDEVTGNPEGVVAQAQTWGNVSDGAKSAASQWRSDASRVLEPMEGTAVDSYWSFASERTDALDALGGAALGMQTAMSVSAGLVGFVHGFLRDMLSQIIGSILSYAVEIVASLGTMVPWVIEQVSTRVAALSGRASTFVNGLINSGSRLGRLLGELRTFGQAVLRFLDRISPNGAGHTPQHRMPGPVEGPPTPGPWTRRPPAGWSPNGGARHAATPGSNLRDSLRGLPGEAPITAGTNGLDATKKGLEGGNVPQ
ncbi:MAG: hypothetical protein LWW86_16490 [Micrococcales bacterium]|nr:hypothetical protein [Micrococcales bacterium]